MRRPGPNGGSAVGSDGEIGRGGRCQLSSSMSREGAKIAKAAKSISRKYDNPAPWRV